MAVLGWLVLLYGGSVWTTQQVHRLNEPEMLNYVIIFWEGNRLRYFGCTGMHPNNQKIISSFIFSYARVFICVYVFMCLTPPKAKVSSLDVSSLLGG